MKKVLARFFLVWYIEKAGRQKGGKNMITIELSISEALNIMRALAFAGRKAKREDDQDALFAIYDRIDAELKKGADDDK